MTIHSLSAFIINEMMMLEQHKITIFTKKKFSASFLFVKEGTLNVLNDIELILNESDQSYEIKSPPWTIW